MTDKSQMIFLSQLFDPEPTVKGLRFIRALSERGINTEVVTGFPNYPGGKIYTGYHNKAILRDNMEGTQVTRLAIYPSHDKSALRRTLSYLSFYCTSVLYLLFFSKKSNIIYSYYPSLTAGLSAVTVKFFRNTPVIIDIQDLWPDSLGSSGMMKNKFLLSIAGRVCKFVYRQCDHIIVLSPGFRQILIDRGVAREKISVIYNWADETTLPERIVLNPINRHKQGFKVLFAGNMGPSQGLGSILKAAFIVQGANPEVLFFFMGEGTEKIFLEKEAIKLGLFNIRFLPRVPLSDVQSYLSSADCLLVHLRDEQLYRITIPSKTQAYLYAGRPIIMAVRGDASDLITKAGAGLVAVPEDACDIANKVVDLASMTPKERTMMGKRGKQFYCGQLSEQSGIDATVRVITRLRRQVL